MNAIPFSLHRSTEQLSDHPADIVGNNISDALAVMKLIFIAADGQPIVSQHPDHFKCLGVVLEMLQRADRAHDEMLQGYQIKKMAGEQP